MSPLNWLASQRRYRVPPMMFCAGSTGSSTNISPAVRGISCISPMAPAVEIAPASPALSAQITARTSAAGHGPAAAERPRRGARRPCRSRCAAAVALQPGARETPKGGKNGPYSEWNDNPSPSRGANLRTPAFWYLSDMRHQFDYLVLGSGIAGLSFALRAARHGSVALLAKRGRSETNTAYAQGGIAAVFGPQDSFEQHVRDTLDAGAGLCREDAVRVTVTEGPARVRELIEMGAEFTRDTTPFGYHLTREGGHSQRRVVHAADLTGMEVERTLLNAAARAGVQFFEDHHAIDLILASRHGGPAERVLGVYALDTKI